jgi:NAD(P)-dependent dehydrogenase (short-subunit alcohol dehydrogenase family)
MAKQQPKRIVLTGVSRGLGRALAAELIGRGHVVAGCARSGEAIAECRRQWPWPQRFDVVDVTDDRAVEHWAEAVLADGVPDLVINNAAAINRSAPLWELSAAEFDTVIDVNLKGVANVIRHFAPALIERGSIERGSIERGSIERGRIERGSGVIVNISSGWGRSTSAEVAPYCATKWGIEGLTQALAAELPAGVAAVAVNPGIIDTDMLRSCFGAGAAGYPQPEAWARGAADFLLALGPKESGRPVSIPGVC